jgi:hypothetical protein
MTRNELQEQPDLPTALLSERDRVRDIIVPQYESIGAAGRPALVLVINPALERAELALTEHDAVAMVRATEELRGIQ